MPTTIDRRACLGGAAGLAALAGWPAACAERPDNPVSATPKLNQLGFIPTAAKRFAIVDGGDLPADAAFTVEDAGGRVAHRGRLGAAVDLSRTAGEHVRAGSCTALTSPGRYVVRVGTRRSPPFTIGTDVYRPLLRDAARAFWLIRANVALDDPVTGLRHAAGHAVEAALPVDGAVRDLTGGWYNAGDYGKWTHMAAISAAQMMWLHELCPTLALPLGVPPTRGLPDLLAQARWGLDWMLRMQNPDGGVLHKVDSEPLFAWGQPPEGDTHPRRAQGPGSIATGVFVGAMLQAQRVFARLDSAYAARCRAAADRAWRWLEAHPAVVAHDASYADPDARQEALWATAAMAAATGDRALAARATAALATLGVVPFIWTSPQLLGIADLARSRSAAAPAARDAIVRAAELIDAATAADPYGASLDPATFSWESNETALNAAVTCLFAAGFADAARHRATAQRIVDYVLGCNALDQCFVTGHGTRPVRRPYHWTMRVWSNPLPGWLAGGANGQPDGADPLLAAVIARGTPPAKCYVDDCRDNGSWASNEGETTANAALVLALGLLV